MMGVATAPLYICRASFACFHAHLSHVEPTLFLLRSTPTAYSSVSLASCVCFSVPGGQAFSYLCRSEQNVKINPRGINGERKLLTDGGRIAVTSSCSNSLHTCPSLKQSRPRPETTTIRSFLKYLLYSLTIDFSPSAPISSRGRKTVFSPAPSPCSRALTSIPEAPATLSMASHVEE